MSGREAVPEMHFTRVPCDDPEITVFGISGSLGPRARPYLNRLMDECRQRDLRRVVLDLSEVESLGGGTAKLLNTFAAERDVDGSSTSFVVVSPIVRSFLCRDSNTRSQLFKSLEEAIAALGSAEEAPADASGALAPPGTEASPFVEDDSWEASSGQSAAGDVPDEEKVRSSIVRALRQHKLASRAHVLSLQADGRFHPVTQSGVDLERGIPADGALAQSVLQHDGPALLYDVCGERLSESEEELVSVLNCEVVARFELLGASEMLVFLSKEQPGDEYTLDELARLEDVLVDVSLEAKSPSSDTIRSPDCSNFATAFRGSDLLVEEGEIEEFGSSRGPEATGNGQGLERKVAKLREILRLGRGFDASFGSSRILDVLVLSLVSLTRSQSVLYFGERDGEYHLTHHRGLETKSLPEMRLRMDSSFVMAACESESAARIEASNRVSDEEKIWARQHGFQYLVPFRSKDRVLGVLILGGPEPVDVDFEMLSYLLHEAALAYDRANLFETLEDRTLGVVRGLMTLIESRDSQDLGSTENVVRYTQALAREIQYPTVHMRDLVYGTVLRDIGMLRVEQNVLNQTGQLSADEWEEVRRHTIEGAATMRQMRFNEIAVEVVLHHHEAYNGEGYPMKLRGRAIPLGARIVAVAEAYVKMTMDRPYRKALGRVEALESLAENWGLRYDPLIVDALVRVVNRELSMGLENEIDFTNHLFGV